MDELRCPSCNKVLRLFMDGGVLCETKGCGESYGATPVECTRRAHGIALKWQKRYYSVTAKTQWEATPKQAKQLLAFLISAVLFILSIAFFLFMAYNDKWSSPKTYAGAILCVLQLAGCGLWIVGAAAMAKVAIDIATD